jgi:hypothetical protein
MDKIGFMLHEINLYEKAFNTSRKKILLSLNINDIIKKILAFFSNYICFFTHFENISYT